MSQKTDFITEDRELSPEIEHLLRRDVNTAKFPDQIFALGGGGRKMVLEMFRQDWFAIEAMRGRTSDIKITFVDTATENQENHREDLKKLQKQCENLSEVASKRGSDRFGRIQVEDVIITEGLNINNRASLTGKRAVDQIKQANNIDYWWIKDEHLSATSGGGMYEVSKGAVKRRALAKGLHYKALAEASDRAYRQALDTIPGDQRVAIFAGLGGGTGSGLFIDIAEEIRNNHSNAEINIFCSLPTRRQRRNTKANAFAALVEMEYVQLQAERQLFNEIILMPLAPTGLDGERTTGEDLEEFDRVLCYTLLGKYNDHDADYAFTRKTKYAPFTIAVPQVLHYNLSEIKRRKDDIYQFLKKKRELLNLEQMYFDDIEDYLDETYPTAKKVEFHDLSDEARDYVIDRLSRFETLVTSDLLNKLNIEIVGTDIEEFSDTIRDSIYADGQNPETTSLTEVFRHKSVEEIFNELQLIEEDYEISGSKVNRYPDFSDDMIQDLVFTEMHNMRRNYELLVRLRGAQIASAETADVGTDADAKLVEVFLLPPLNRGTEQNRRLTVKNLVEEAEEEIREKRQRKEELKAEKEEEEEKIQQELRQKKSEFERKCGDYIEDLENIKGVDVSDEINAVENALSNYAEQVSREEGPNPSTNEIDNAITSLKRKLQEVFDSDVSNDFASVNLDDLSTQADRVREARERWDDLEEEKEDSDGIFRRLIGGSNSNEPIETRQYDRTIRAIDDSIFDVPDSPSTTKALDRTDFNVTYKNVVREDVNDYINEKKQELEDGIEEGFENIVEEAEESEESAQSGPSHSIIAEEESNGSAPSALTDITSVVENANDVRNAVMGEIESEIKSRIGEKVDDLEQEIEQVESEINQAQERKESFGAVYNTFQELNRVSDRPIRDIHDEYVDDFDDELLDLPQGRRSGRISINEAYEQQVTPDDLTSAIHAQSLVSSKLLQEGSQERQEVLASVNRIIENKLKNSRYNGLAEWTFNTTDEESFTQTGVYLSVAGEVVASENPADTELSLEDFEMVEDGLVGMFNLGATGQETSEQHESWFIQNGDPWEIGMCVYIQGITFLDNLVDVVGTANGFWPRYRNLVRQSSSVEAVARHAYDLENGHYVTRQNIIEVPGNEDLYLSKNEDEIIERLQDEYKIVNID